MKYSIGKHPNSLRNLAPNWVSGVKKGPFTNEHRRNLSLALQGKPQPWSRGANSNFWRGGVSKINKTEKKLAMSTLEYKLWRRTILERDNYSCQICLKRGGDLEVDHIKSWNLYPELRYAIDNGRVLCVACHRLTENWGYKSRNRFRAQEV